MRVEFFTANRRRDKMGSKEQFHLREVPPALLWFEVDDLSFSLIPVEFDDWLGLIRIDLLSLHYWFLAIILSND